MLAFHLVMGNFISLTSKFFFHVIKIIKIDIVIIADLQHVQSQQTNLFSCFGSINFPNLYLFAVYFQVIYHKNLLIINPDQISIGHYINPIFRNPFY